MRIHAQLLPLLLLTLLWPCTPALAQTDDKAFNAFIQQQIDYHKAHPDQPLEITRRHHAEEAAGSGGEARAQGDAVKEKVSLESPPVSLPGGGGAGRARSTGDLAASITGSSAFRVAAGIVGGIVLVLGIFIGKQGNLRGAVIVGGSGLAVLAGAIWFPDWLGIGLLGLFLFTVAEYAYTHGLLTGALASVATAVHKAGPLLAAEFNSAVSGFAENNEAAALNRIARANDATSVKV